MWLEGTDCDNRAMADPLAPLLELSDMGAAFGRLTPPAPQPIEPVDRAAGELRAACASLRLDGYSVDVEQVRAGLVTDARLDGALACYAALPALVPVWRRSPPQVLAQLHVLAATGEVDAESLGRPQLAPDAVDRFRFLTEVLVGDRASGLAQPSHPDVELAVVRAAVVHAELLTLAPFGTDSGLLARVAARLTLAATGFDPALRLVMEEQHQARNPEYVGSANAYATGRRDGVRAWLRHYAAVTAASLAADGAAAAGQLSGAV